MKKLHLVSALIVLFAFAATSRAQGNLGTCSITHYQLGTPFSTVVELQDILLTCPNLNRYVTQENYQFKLILVAQPSGGQSSPFAGNAFIFRDQVLFRTPFRSTGSTSLTLFVLGFGSYLINFNPPVITSAPVLIAVKTVVLDRIEISTAPPDPNIIPRIRIRYLITFRMDNVGPGGTFLFHFVKADGSEVQRIGKVFPRSSGLAEPEGQVDVYDDELVGVVGVFVTDPNDASIPPSNTLPVMAALPSA